MKRFRCWLLGHKFTHVAVLSDQAEKIACKRCRRLFAINYSVPAILSWDYDLEMFYRRFPAAAIKEGS